MTDGKRAIDESCLRLVESIKSVVGSEGFLSSCRKLTRGSDSEDVVERTQKLPPLAEVTTISKQICLTAHES